MKLILVISCIFFTLISSSLFANESQESDKPAIYKIMDSVELPYIAQCHPDPWVVQEYLLVMETEYLTWLKKEVILNRDESEDRDDYIEKIDQSLLKNVEELKEIQKTCVSYYLNNKK